MPGRIDVLGTIWMPAVTAAYSYTLSEYDIHNIEQEHPAQGISRADISAWLDKNAGDFQSIEDFSATINDAEYGWKDEESEWTFSDLMYGSEE